MRGIAQKYRSVLIRLLGPGCDRDIAAIFLLLTLVGLAAIWIGNYTFERQAAYTALFDNADRLRMLSQRLASGAHRAIADTPESRRQLVALIGTFDEGLSALATAGDSYGIAEADAAGPRPTLEKLRRKWRLYRAAVDIVARQQPGTVPVRNALRYIDSQSDELFETAQETTRHILVRHDTERQRLNHLLLAAATTLGIFFAAGPYLYLRRRIPTAAETLAEASLHLATGGCDATPYLDAERARSERIIRDSELRTRILWENSSDAILIVDQDDVIRSANRAVADLTGYAPDDLIGQDMSALLPPQRKDANRADLARCRETATPADVGKSAATSILHKSGKEIPVECIVVNMRLSSSRLLACFFRDVSKRLEAQTALRLRDRAIEAADEGIMITDAVAADHPILYVNPAVERITEYAREELLGRNARFLVADELDSPEAATLRHLLREHREDSVVLRCRRKGGGLWWNELSVAPVRDDDGKVTNYISIFKDVTERKRHEEELIRNAHHDALTGLPNRVLLHDRLEQAIAVAGRHARSVGVLFVDIDNFKIVNDSLGHDTGDLLLLEVAKRLQTCLRDGDTAARLGGDEFVLLLNEVGQEHDIVLVAERILNVLAAPFVIADKDIYLGASIGTSIYPRDGEDGQVLLRHADIAMHRAKDQGRNNHQGFTDEMQSSVTRRLSLETSLRKALERDEFQLYYQPQVSLESGSIVGAEALIRWFHPELGVVSPAQFIPLAEETCLILPIGEWVLDQACAQSREWFCQGYELSTAINLSARQFRQTNLLQLVEEKLNIYGLDGNAFEVELTESMVMHDPETTIRILGLMKEMGLRISLDDFGTGYSSLAYLRRFPIDVLKIDQSFVRDVTTDVDAAAITASIVALARNLRLGVVAEGVETREQLDYLRRQKCDAIQGYYFSKPLPADEFTSLLASGKRLERGDSDAHDARFEPPPPLSTMTEATIRNSLKGGRREQWHPVRREC